MTSKLESLGSVRCNICGRFVPVVKVKQGESISLQIAEHYPEASTDLYGIPRSVEGKGCSGVGGFVNKSELVDIP